MASLIITSGEQAGSHFLLAKRPLAGGRDPSRDIQVVDPKVSRRHFQIRQYGDDHVIIDLKSPNGVYVNGSRINGEQVLTDGDGIRVGDTAMTFYVADAPDRSDGVQKYKRADRPMREDRTVNE